MSMERRKEKRWNVLHKPSTLETLETAAFLLLQMHTVIHQPPGSRGRGLGRTEEEAGGNGEAGDRLRQRTGGG